MILLSLSHEDIQFLIDYEDAYDRFNLLESFGESLTEKGQKLKKETDHFLKFNTGRYMALTSQN